MWRKTWQDEDYIPRHADHIVIFFPYKVSKMSLLVRLWAQLWIYRWTDKESMTMTLRFYTVVNLKLRLMLKQVKCYACRGIASLGYSQLTHNRCPNPSPLANFVAIKRPSFFVSLSWDRPSWPMIVTYDRLLSATSNHTKLPMTDSNHFFCYTHLKTCV